MPSSKHYFSIARDGTILEASTYVVGFPTEMQLMTSVYDSIFEEDLPGFLCIKTQFWDKGIADAEVYIRRKSWDGQLTWLISKGVGFVNEGGIFAAIIEEVLANDIEIAKGINKTTKILSVLIQAVEASWLVGRKSMQYLGLADEVRTRPNGSRNVDVGQQQHFYFNPDEHIQAARSGVRLDLGTNLLSSTDVKIISLVLSGTLPLSQIVPYLKSALSIGFCLREAIQQFTLDCERPIRLNDNFPKHPWSNFANIPPQISVLNLSCTFIGNSGAEMISEILYRETICLKTLDLSFCNIEERGLLSLSDALTRRRRMGIVPLIGLFLSGNYISDRSAIALGSALTVSERKNRSVIKKRKLSTSGKFEIGNYFEQQVLLGQGLRVLHLASTSISSEGASQLILGLGHDSTLRELNISSNNFCAKGAEKLAEAFERAISDISSRESTYAVPFLQRLDLSNNDIGDSGSTRITKTFMNRNSSHFVDLKLSFNSIGLKGVETSLNHLLHNNLRSLSLDKNYIGDSGCQLVAASVLSMKALCRLNLGFNQIGSRGITSLMRSLVTCESITYLGLSGNMLKIAGSIALAFLLAQHPRLEELDVENCCLDEPSQCHIVAGILSNRLVTMKRLKGFALGPPMVVIRALDPSLAHSSNDECLRIRFNEQMRTFLLWMETNRIAKQKGGQINLGVSDEVVTDFMNARFLSPDFVASMNDIHGVPSQNPYFRLLGWLSRFPFYEDELTALQKFFYDVDGGEGGRGSDGSVNLKLRGDMLADLTNDRTDSRGELLNMQFTNETVGIDLDTMFVTEEKSLNKDELVTSDCYSNTSNEIGESHVLERITPERTNNFCLSEGMKNSQLTRVKSGLSSSGTLKSTQSVDKDNKPCKGKPRITLFPLFEQQLAELRNLTTELIEKEEDLDQHEIILTQYAEAVLVILRQLRYLCMNCGLDGWRGINVKRKILIVDDTLTIRKLVTRAFEKANFVVDSASNGAEGVTKLKESLYDIVFMDIEMPVMDGLEATKQLRAWEDEHRPGARQPICALTGTDTNQKQLREMREAGIDVIEKKPCHIPRLFKVVDDVSPMFSDLNTNVSSLKPERTPLDFVVNTGAK